MGRRRIHKDCGGDVVAHKVRTIVPTTTFAYKCLRCGTEMHTDTPPLIVMDLGRSVDAVPELGMSLLDALTLMEKVPLSPYHFQDTRVVTTDGVNFQVAGIRHYEGSERSYDDTYFFNSPDDLEEYLRR